MTTDQRPAPPPRPSLVSRVPPPRPPAAGPVPRALRGAATVWGVALLAGGTALAAAAVDLDGARSRLAAVAAEQDPQATSAALRSGVATTLLLPLGTVLAVLLVGTGALVLLLGRRTWSRWVLGVLAGVGSASAVVAADVLRGGPWIDEAGFLGCAGLLVVVLVAVVSRPVGRWLAVGR